MGRFFNTAHMFEGAQAAAGGLGSELMTNGDISGGSTGWTDLSSLGTCTFTGGVITVAANDTLLLNFGTEAGIEEGKTYRVVYTIASVTIAASGVKARIGLSEGIARTTAGAYSEDLLADSIGDEGGFRLANVSGVVTMTFDNFSCKEVL